MGKNHGKRGAKTPVAKWDSLMKRTENELLTREKEKKSKSRKNKAS